MEYLFDEIRNRLLPVIGGKVCVMDNKQLLECYLDNSEAIEQVMKDVIANQDKLLGRLKYKLQDVNQDKDAKVSDRDDEGFIQTVWLNEMYVIEELDQLGLALTEFCEKYK